MEPENATVEETSDSDAESETMVAYGEFYMHFPCHTIPPPMFNALFACERKVNTNEFLMNSKCFVTG